MLWALEFVQLVSFCMCILYNSNFYFLLNGFWRNLTTGFWSHCFQGFRKFLNPCSFLGLYMCLTLNTYLIIRILILILDLIQYVRGSQNASNGHQMKHISTIFSCNYINLKQKAKFETNSTH